MLDIGEQAPEIELRDDHNQVVKLSSLQGKVVILYFYPKDFTPGCTTEACDFRDNHVTFENANSIVLGISPDGVAKHEKFVDKLKLPFRLLADEDHQVMEAYGAWGKKKLYGREYEGVIRSTILIDRDGKIAKVWKSVKVKGHVDKVMAEVDKLS